MQNILEGLMRAVEGGQCSLVVDGTGQMLAYQACAIYDRALLEQVSKTIISAIDAVQLLNQEWDTLTSTFSDGSLTLRSLKPSGPAAGRTVVLGLVGDTRLNSSFANVGMRVASAKLKTCLENPSSISTISSSHLVAAGTSAGSSPSRSSATLRAVAHGSEKESSTGLPAIPEIASGGLAWSGLGSTSMGPGSSEVQVADSASSAFLTACTKALARAVGPLAQLLVKKELRKLCPDRPFSREMADNLIAALRTHIDNPANSAEFQKKMRDYLG
jgi:hypothetical protein